MNCELRDRRLGGRGRPSVGGGEREGRQSRETDGWEAALLVSVWADAMRPRSCCHRRRIRFSSRMAGWA